MQRYNPKEIEPKWQAVWRKKQAYRAIDFDKKSKYVMLTEFPYPSGDGLHMGHIREYTYGDMLARQKRMQGFNVLYPMGFDEFGLPTENYAIKNKITPQSATTKNVATFEQQMESLGYSFDWERKVNTSDPAYYKWTQWLFLQFFKAGLAYQDEIAINWCPHCKTGLSNEEVINGRHERCDTLVEKKILKQWLLKITDYADRLIDGLKDVDYPSRIADQQINWIGRSSGADINFQLTSDDKDKPNFVILHGFTGYADKNFIPWLKKNLEAKGYKVQAPQMPNTDNPKEAEQVGHVLKNCTFDKNTVLVGHSLGGAVAMKVLEKLDVKIRELLLVAPAVEPKFSSKKRTFWDNFDFTYDYKGITQKTGKVSILSDNAEVERENYLIYLSQQLGCPLHKVDAVEEHFIAKEEPAILDLLQPSLKVFTTRADTIFSAAFMVLAPEHSFVNQITTKEKKAKVAAYVKAAQTKSDIERQEDKEKTGVFTGTYAVNPSNGEKIPIWIGDFVLAGYGTGAIFGDIHDERDFEFIKKFNIPARVTVIPEDKTEAEKVKAKEYAYTGEGILINSGEFSGQRSEVARDKIIAWLAKKGAAKEVINYKLRDWIFSRQHYWGEPIPIIHCPEHGAVAVPDDRLPVELPVVKNYEPTDTGESPLAAISEWVNVECPKCGKPAKRETDTMPNWAGSSWYYLRYYDAHNDGAFADRKKLDYWGEVDMYLGGMEHTTLHLLYSRFWHQFFYDQKLVPTSEPYKARRGQGIILAADNSKMSKSKGNIVNPTDIIENGYGADALRLAIAFLAPYDQTTPWGPESVAGTHRFLQRVWVLAQEFMEASGGTEESVEIKRVVHKAIKKVSEDLRELSFNTAIAALMECVNELYKIKADKSFTAKEWPWALETLLQLLAPFAPHIAEELWQQLGQEESVHISQWPTYDEKYLVQDKITVVIQVNGKLRGEVQVATDASEEAVVKAAKVNDKVAGYLSGKDIRKTVYVPGKLVNFVV